MSPWLLACGYVGVVLSVVFGVNQLRVIWQKHSSENVSLLDYGMRVVYSVLLGAYAAGKRDLVFVIANVAAALISLAVVGVGSRQRRQGQPEPEVMR